MFSGSAHRAPPTSVVHSLTTMTPASASGVSVLCNLLEKSEDVHFASLFTATRVLGGKS